MVSSSSSLRSRLPTNRWLWALPWSPVLVCSGVVFFVSGALAGSVAPPRWWTILAVYGGVPASVLAHLGLLRLESASDRWVVASVVGAAVLVGLAALDRPGLVATPATAFGALTLAGNLTVTPVAVLTVARRIRAGAIA